MAVSRESIAVYAARFEHDVGHAHQVARLAEALFDALMPVHGLGELERERLVQAALVHDIGWCEGQQKHHKRALDLIVSDPPDGLDKREAAIVANVARYHRRALPSLSHQSYASLGEADRDIVRKLAAILRIADGLDVTHADRSEIAGCAIDSDTVTIELVAREPIEPELGAAQKKSDLFLEVFGKEIAFRVSR